MSNEIKIVARQQIGEYLKGIRVEKGISTYRMTKEWGLKFEVIQAIEDGSSNYTIDSFLSYIGAIECCFYLESK